MPLHFSDAYIEPLRPDYHQRRGFKCRVEKIQNFCHNNIHKQHKSNMIRAYVACAEESPEILGFYSLNLSSLEVGQIDEVSDKKFERYRAVPVVYLGMIAVHDDCARRGLGKKLMGHAIQTSAEIANLAGMYALTLDALDESLVTYYSQFDFLPFKKGKKGLEMFLPITTIRAALEASFEAE